MTIRAELISLLKENGSVIYFEDGELAGALTIELGRFEYPTPELQERTLGPLREMGLGQATRADLERSAIPFLWVDGPFRDAIRRITARIVLPDTTTAQNLETYLMNAVWWFNAADALGPKASQYAIGVSGLVGAYNRTGLDQWLDIDRNVQAFSHRWRRSGFARLDVGHKLAAALMFTDIKDVALRCPWEAVSIKIPDGLCGDFRRLWVAADDDQKPSLISAVTASGRASGTSPDKRVVNMTDAQAQLLECFMNGALLSVTDTATIRSGKHGAAGKTKRHSGPPVAGELYVLGGSIDLDLRASVQAVWSGEKHSGPKVQFIVRGHWREQACGPSMTLRKRIWIKPFWKGPEESRVLLRKYTAAIKEEKGQQMGGETDGGLR